MMSASARMQGIVAQTTVAYLHIVPANRRRNVYLRLAECGSENEKTNFPLAGSYTSRYARSLIIVVSYCVRPTKSGGDGLSARTPVFIVPSSLGFC